MNPLSAQSPKLITKRKTDIRHIAINYISLFDYTDFFETLQCTFNKLKRFCFFLHRKSCAII